MNHPGFIFGSRLLVVLLALGGNSLAAGETAGADDDGRPAAATTPRANVLLIAVDDLNDWVGCLGGHPQAKTPHIDRLAGEGVLFANAHCQAPICNPSRVSMLTGTRPTTNGIYLLGPTDFRRACPLLADPKATPTLPEHFAAHGYRTLGAGKIYHGGGSRDTFQQYGPAGGAGPFPRRKLAYPQGGKLWDWGRFPARDEQQSDHAVADWAIERLKADEPFPFFLAVGFVRPHVPLFAPEKWWRLHGETERIALPATRPDDGDDIADFARKLTWSGQAPRHQWMVENDQWQTAVHAYLACVSYVDHEIGRVLDALRSGPHADRTIVVLWSDHGWTLGEKERWAKRALWECETRVPLVIAGPGIEPGRVCRQPAGLIDLYPTLNDLCGLPQPEHLEGRSLAAQLSDVAAERPPVLTSFFRGNHAVRSLDWRYIRYADGSEELYDHRHDPHEWNNLAGDVRYRPIIQQHAQHLPQHEAAPAEGSSGLGARAMDLHLFPGAR